MSNLLKNKNFVGGVCIAIAGIIAFLILPGFYHSKEATTKIYKLTNDVIQGTKIEEKMLQEIEVGIFGLPSDVIKDKKLISGKFAKANISKEDFLLPFKLADYSTDEELDKIMGANKRLVSVSLASTSAGVANHLLKGDVVSIACFIPSKSGGADTVEIYPELHGLVVYSIENAKTQNVSEIKKNGDSSPNNDQIPATITLIVTEQQAQKLILAEYTGKLHAIFEKRGASN